MLNSDALLDQALRGPIPEDWRVFPGQGKPLWLAALSALITLIVLCIIELGLLISLGPLSILGWLVESNPGVPSGPQGTPHPVDYHHLIPLVQNLSLSFWIVPVVVALLVMVVGYRRGLAFRHSLMLLTPDGVVQCHNYLADPRDLKVLDFSQARNLVLQLSPNDGSSRARIWLDVERNEGHVEQWPVDTRYGSVEKIIQGIIEYHALYVARDEQQAI
ncbi:hypothetical protein KDI_43100 [Dictyobacter arantiisoli]|uniref:Uncharacterized protein n=2 Tax=Dictyobacter arantiisoli TaxID=2014874 RepID=A0A5A5THY1_9CHLR|nr:hypothetical protein KDI_43100 [Dictyobacter arantiisoli]